MRSIATGIAVLALCFIVVGCTVTRIGEPRKAQPRGSAEYRHEATGFRFPSQVGNLERSDVTVFDPMGRDVGVSYKDKATGLVVTVYVYPIPLGYPDNKLAGHFASSKAELTGAHSKIKIVSEQGIKLAMKGEICKGYRAVFSYPSMSGNQPIHTELYLFEREKYYIKYRISYSTSHEANAAPELVRFMDELTWP